MASSAQTLDNLRSAYATLGHRVQRALQIHLGDQTRLGEHRSQVLRFLQSADQVCLQSVGPCLKLW